MIWGVGTEGGAKRDWEERRKEKLRQECKINKFIKKFYVAMFLQRIGVIVVSATMTKRKTMFIPSSFIN